MVKGAACPQIILGVNLEKTEVWIGLQYLGEMLWFKAQARPEGQAVVALRIEDAAR